MLPFKRIAIDTFREWLRDHAAQQGAALAFYSVLSLGPLLLIVISVAGIFFGQEAASGHIFAQIQGLIGEEGAETIQIILANSRSESKGFWATLAGFVTLLIASTGVFGQLQDTLNSIWKVPPKKGYSFWRIIRKRFLSFALILAIGFLLLISLVVSAALAAFSDYFTGLIPEMMMQGVNFMLSFAVTTVLFAMMFKILPDADIGWHEVWIGAVLTAALFSIGKFLIGLYLGHSALSSTYGAAGSLVVILIWIYYSAQILFLGAEFTQVHANYQKRGPNL